jgi:hypothetical protein
MFATPGKVPTIHLPCDGTRNYKRLNCKGELPVLSQCNAAAAAAVWYKIDEQIFSPQ